MFKKLVGEGLQVSNVKLFENQKIRSIWIETEQKWNFSVADVVDGLTDSADAKAYWRQLKRREPQLVTDCHGFKLEAADGKQRKKIGDLVLSTLCRQFKLQAHDRWDVVHQVRHGSCFRRSVKWLAADVKVQNVSR